MNRLLPLILTLILLSGTLSASDKYPFKTKTPIKYLVVIFQENRPFDHYFGTYPKAANFFGDPCFKARRNTPSVNGLTTTLTTLNQNLVQPFRISRNQAFASGSDPRHRYTSLQAACNSGLMDKFVEVTGVGCTPPTIVMGHFDGNTVTALWNYAQYFAMSDNFRTTNIGGSTAGALNLISGQTHGAIPAFIPDIVAEGTLINDTDPTFDQCSAQPTVEMTGFNIGNLLNAKGITWGWFQGGFANCSASHIGPSGLPVTDYIPHHNPFQYYQSTSNPQHLPPSSIQAIGKNDQANHIYDISDFWAAVKEEHIPAVSLLKAPAYQDGHAGYSDPLFEQEFLVTTINKLQKLSQWKDMAIIIAYDDSGGWYDHECPVLINHSQLPEDVFGGPGNCGLNPPLGGYQGRPAFGQRVPCVVISPWAKENYVDHLMIDQTSILRFIEDNWNLGRIGNFSFDQYANKLDTLFNFKKRHKRHLFLCPETGRIIH